MAEAEEDNTLDVVYCPREVATLITVGPATLEALEAAVECLIGGGETVWVAIQV
jgi:hypothetical protein